MIGLRQLISERVCTEKPSLESVNKVINVFNISLQFMLMEGFA